ncbi:MAG: LysM domain-containing protein [Eubacterium sp.]|nr:LysM domain-containing protein [Eubacterium sp.]MCM1238742.1 LysM domain-containing protein [Lachnospiraceae bacterium]MCM1342656.1 LysM domain-containing protein [Muribaculaceae bacterium]MCM1409711.1 LysM domain-containing protein [Lachnospiraceae bacterium]
MKKKTAIIFAVTLTAALSSASGSTRTAAAEDVSAIISHTVVIGEPGNMAASDWNDMLKKLDVAIQEGKGQNVNVTVGDSVIVPTDVLNRLAGQNATLALHMTDGPTFSISGGDIDRVEYPVQITMCGESGIPEDVRGQLLEGITISREFTMEEKDAYPCRVNAHLAFGPQNAGRHAVLYFYDEFDGTMRQEGFCRIQESGNAMFGLNRGDEYIVVVMKGYTIEDGDVLSRIAVRNGISLKSLMAANPQIADSDKIRVGQMINIPAR